MLPMWSLLLCCCIYCSCSIDHPKRKNRSIIKERSKMIGVVVSNGPCIYTKVGWGGGWQKKEKKKKQKNPFISLNLQKQDDSDLHRLAMTISACGSRCHTKLRCQCRMFHRYSRPADEWTMWHCTARQLYRKPDVGDDGNDTPRLTLQQIIAIWIQGNRANSVQTLLFVDAFNYTPQFVD